MIKLLCGVTFLGISILFGVKLRQKEIERLEIFNELVMLCDSFKNEIYFKYTTVDKLTNLPKSLSGVLFGAGECLKKGEKFTCVDKRLNTAEKNTITNFINQLGIFDENGSMNFFDAYKQQFSAYYSKQQSKCDFANKCYIRMGVFVGILILILMV